MTTLISEDFLGNKIYIDKNGEPENKIIYCTECSHIWRSWFVDSWCAECGVVVVLLKRVKNKSGFAICTKKDQTAIHFG